MKLISQSINQKKQPKCATEKGQIRQQSKQAKKQTNKKATRLLRMTSFSPVSLFYVIVFCIAMNI